MPELELLDDDVEVYDVEDIDDDTEDDEYDALAEIEELLESIEEDGDYDEDDAERRRRRRGRRGSRGRGRMRRPTGRRVSTAGGRGLYQRPPTRDQVTQSQLKQALDKVGGEIRKNATAIKAVNTQITRVNTRVAEVNNRLSGRIDTVSAVNERQNKAIAGVKRQQEGLQQGMLFSALLGGSRKVTVESATRTDPRTGAVTTDPALANTTLQLKDSGDKFERLLPVLAAGGGFGGTSGSAGGGLMSNPLLLILLLDKD